MRMEGLRGISRGFPRLSPCGGQVPYVLLTRAPVAGGRVATPPLPLDLHVLGLSLAFILSQDQTLRCCYLFLSFSFVPSIPGVPSRRPGVVLSRVSLLSCLSRPTACAAAGRLQHHFNVLWPRPEGRACKVNDFLPFFQTPAALPFGGPGAVSRLRLQRYYRFSLFSKFSANFFSSFFAPFPQLPVNHRHPPQTFFTGKTPVPAPDPKNLPESPFLDHFSLTPFNTTRP